MPASCKYVNGISIIITKGIKQEFYLFQIMKKLILDQKKQI